MMSLRALIIAVEKYPVLREALAGDLSDTIATALAFREWLVTTKQVSEANIFFCSEPRVPVSTAGATRADIRMAILKLRDAGAGDTSELYFFFSGHGYAQLGMGKEPTANALLASDYESHSNTSDNALSHDEIVRVLRCVLGPGVHFHFIDVCRFGRKEEDFPVGNLAIPAKPRDTGQATVHVLYSTSLGDAARVNSAFGDALVEGLHGKARAKEWFMPTAPPRKLAVRFQSLANHIRAQVKGQIPDPNPSESGPGVIYEFIPPMEKRCTITVTNAQPTDSFDMLLGDADQQEIRRETFAGARHEFQRLPNDYHVAVTKAGSRVEPAGWVHVDLFEDAAKNFRLITEIPPDPTGVVPPILPEGSSMLNVLLPATAHGVLRKTSTGQDIPLTGVGPGQLMAGHYELEVKDADGWTVRRQSIEARPGSEQTIDLTPAPTPLHEEILRAVPGADFSESFGGPLADQDPALWLALLGAARIVRRPHDDGDFSKLKDLPHLPLEQLVQVLPGGSALYLLVGLEENGGSLHVGHSTMGNPIPYRWERVKTVRGFQHLSHHAAPMSPGPGLLSLSLGKISIITLATAFLPNRATLVTVTQDRHGSLQVHQMMLPMGHLVDELPAEVRDRAYFEDEQGRSRTRSVKFIVQAQRAFRQRQEMNPENQPRTRELESLLYGKWLDPVMAALASYELLRRGKREHLVEVADNMQTYFSGLPDSGALARLVIEATPSRTELSPNNLDRFNRLVARAASPRRGWPLFLDGLAAFEDNERNLPLPASRLDYRGMWTLWRGAVPNPAHYFPWYLAQT
jgi:hypothetical protein